MTSTEDFRQNWDLWLKLLEKRLKPRRLQHSVSVSETARYLAEKHGYDPSLAGTAGLLHDYARDMKARDLLSLAEEFHLSVDSVERQVPVLLHGPVGARLVKQDLGVSHQEVLEAISWHTTAAPGMSQVAGIVYLADIIEPLRDFSGVDRLREQAQADLDAAVLEALEGSIRYCMKAGQIIHPRSIEARNYWLSKNCSTNNLE